MLTGKTGNLGVMGWPIAHSLSPAMQNAALAKAGIDYVYTALPVEPVHLAAAVAGLRALRFRGWNVTIPHKQAVIDLLDEIDEDAQIIGAVNTVVQENGRLMGFNTDVVGFLAGLAGAGFSLAQKRVVLLGAGGAARAVLWGLIKSGASRVAIGVRHPEKAEMLRQAFSPRAVAGGTAGAALRWGVARGIFSNEAGMGSAAITAASAGGSPALQGYIHMTGVFFDTMVVCTVTGLAICCSGVLGAADPATGLPAEGAALTILAFETVLGPAGRVFLAVSIALFAFSSMLGWACQGETALAYLAGRRAVPLYRCLFAAAAWAGAFLDVEEAFGLSDLCNCLMALPNLACLLLLSGAAAREMESFQPEFHRNSRRKPVNFL